MNIYDIQRSPIYLIVGKCVLYIIQITKELIIFGASNKSQQNIYKQQTMHADDYEIDIKLNSAMPIGNIKHIKWASDAQLKMFAATSWESTIRLIKYKDNSFPIQLAQVTEITTESPALSCCWNDDSTALFFGCVDGSIKVIDINTQQISQIGKQNAPISDIHFIPKLNILISDGFQKYVHFWQNGPKPIFSINVNNKVYASDYKNGIYAAGTAQQNIVLADMQTVTQGKITIIPSNQLGKGSPIQSISMDQKANYLGIGSIDGRGNLSTIKQEFGALKITNLMTFKACKKDQLNKNIMFPVNSVSFNPRSQKWFMTAGSNGQIAQWDFNAKNSIRKLNFASNPICCAAVSTDGKYIAYANGNDWHIGQDQTLWQSRIGMHIVTDQQLKHKY